MVKSDYSFMDLIIINKTFVNFKILFISFFLSTHQIIAFY